MSSGYHTYARVIYVVTHLVFGYDLKPYVLRKCLIQVVFNRHLAQFYQYWGSMPISLSFMMNLQESSNINIGSHCNLVMLDLSTFINLDILDISAISSLNPDNAILLL